MNFKHLRMGSRCNIAVEMAHDMTRNAHRHTERDYMLCIRDIHDTVAWSIWRLRGSSMQREVRDPTIQV